MQGHDDATLVCERRRPTSDERDEVVAIGEIDIGSAPRLRNVLREAQARARHVVLDLDGMSFIDANGARILLAAEARARATAGTFAIARPTPHVLRLLQLVGADRLLTTVEPQRSPQRLG